MSANGKQPYLPFYVSDYLSDAKVQRMSTLEEGAYLRLLFFAWCDERKSLLDDEEELACLAKLSVEEFREHRDRIMAPFHKNGDERWHQKRLEIEWAALESKQKAWSEAGRLGNEKRWGSDRVAIARRSGGDPHARYQSSPVHSSSYVPAPTDKEPQQRGSGGDDCLIDPERSSQTAPSELWLEAEEAKKPEAKAKLAVRTPLMTNAKLKELQGNPAYEGMDLVKEAFKFNAWCDTNGKTKSVRRFVNWINKI